jgi:hypothetical protein
VAPSSDIVRGMGVRVRWLQLVRQRLDVDYNLVDNIEYELAVAMCSRIVASGRMVAV